MKKLTAILVSLLLGIVMMTGCSSQTSTTATTATPTPTPVKASLDPTAAINTTLTNNTLYDESTFGIVIPKGATFVKASNIYSWTILTDKYVVQVQMATSTNTSITVASLTANEAAMNALVSSFESASNDEIKMDSGYKKTTISGKTALLISGKVTADEGTGTIEMYYIDSSKGLLFLAITKVQEGTDATTKTAMDKVATDIFNSITIK